MSRRLSTPIPNPGAALILPRRISHIRDSGGWNYDFSYDCRGRVVSVRKTLLPYDECIATVEYVADGVKVSFVDSYFRAEYRYCLIDGRAVSVGKTSYLTGTFREESAETFSYDAEGYLAGHTFEQAAFRSRDTYAVADGVLTGWAWYGAYGSDDAIGDCPERKIVVESDLARPNNLNLDLWGLEAFVFGDHDAYEVLLYGIGGRRFRTLPARIVRHSDSGEAGEYLYHYDMEGEYVSGIEIVGNAAGVASSVRLELFYEE